jgi:hypothetical protein
MFRKHFIFILILTFAAATRVVVLFQSQTHVHSDEAVIGLMAKHISEGRYFPFYMYGQPYNAAAALEAYAAAVPFAVFGPGAVPLKACIVLASLACLILFYRLAYSLYGQRTAEWAAWIFVLSPSLLKWHFQVRGYSFYFLSILILSSLFLAADRCSASKAKMVFYFGLASGLSVWCLELILSLTCALWLLLAVRRKLSLRDAAAGAAGFVVGYLPAIGFNLAGRFSNWLVVFGDKAGGGISSLFNGSTIGKIFFEEMPKFFGPDTVLWYYDDIPIFGAATYAIAAVAAIAAAFPFLGSFARFRGALRGKSSNGDENGDFLMLTLAAASFAPYLAAPTRVPGYFLGGVFFLSILEARLLVRCFGASAKSLRILGAATAMAISAVGIDTMVEVGMRNQIETLSFDKSYNVKYMSRFPGKDIEAVERHLRQNHVTALWATVSFVYPLIFESGETQAVSAAVFGWDHPIYPSEVPWSAPDPDRCRVFVVETHSPFRPTAEALCKQNAGVAPRVTEYGTLTVIEQMPP